MFGKVVRVHCRPPVWGNRRARDELQEQLLLLVVVVVVEAVHLVWIRDLMTELEKEA